MKLDIKTLNSKKFGLFESQNQLGTLTYNSSFTKDNGTIEVNNATISMFKNKGFLSSEIQIIRDNQIVFSIVQKFSGTLEIRSESNNKKYWLKSKNFWQGTKVLLDENQRELLVELKKYNWKNWSYDYSFETTNDFELLSEKELLLFCLFQGEQKIQANTIAAMIPIFIVIISATNH